MAYEAVKSIFNYLPAKRKTDMTKAKANVNKCFFFRNITNMLAFLLYIYENYEEISMVKVREKITQVTFEVWNR